MSTRKSKSIYAENTWIALVHITSICAIQIADNCELHQRENEIAYDMHSLMSNTQRLEIEINSVMVDFVITSTISDRSRSRRSN